MATEKQITEAMLLVVAEYRQQFASMTAKQIDGKLAFWKVNLKDLDGDLLEAALMKSINNAPVWPPTSSAIRKAARELLQKATNQLTATEAWGIVCLAAENSTGAHLFDERTASTLRAIGGLKMLGQANDSAMISHRMRFVECYNEFKQRDDDDTLMLPEVTSHIARLKAENFEGSVKGLVEGFKA